ncbi:DNA glycosylase [Legionella norrlandica]|uniref:Adenine DNA glycosylase n=1 Tax=Legionella norrlandica TaxID=1498499 RepID=A0A0A2STP9_9GAMM|nr:A/G-specific adenine glycosylase [Legionella norrlandica]KGP64137.1 DNA glycosylase [Legionella norrlandica]
MSSSPLNHQFSQLLLDWYDLHGRKDLPWQSPRTPYRVWVSEIMLQQTQVQTVIPYFNRFIEHFPEIALVARAEEDEVLSLWSGLGYYSRARNLHKTAQIINEQYHGLFPEDLDALVQLPGIGASTAAAILSQAFNKPTAILDGNVKRVLSRYFLVDGWPEQAQVKKKLWDLAYSCMPEERCADYTQAIMDLGATRCTNKNPDCLHCPLQKHCLAFQKNEQLLYPTKKIKKQRPIFSQQLLVLHNEEGQIYLEKRPPTGLWGGLWCFPALDSEACPSQYIELHYKLKGEKPELITKFKHSFSHFHLEITALSIKIRKTNTNSLSSKLTVVNEVPEKKEFGSTVYRKSHEDSGSASTKHPTTIEFDKKSNIVSEAQGTWFRKEKLSSLGLAKPTTLILSKLYNWTTQYQ